MCFQIENVNTSQHLATLEYAQPTIVVIKETYSVNPHFGTYPTVLYLTFLSAKM